MWKELRENRTPGAILTNMLIAAVRRIVEFTEQFQRGITGIERFFQIMDADIEIFSRIASALGITFHHSEFAPNNVPLLPTQLMSSALNFLHFFILVAVSRHTKKTGTVAKLYLILYSIGRFLLEFLRGDNERGYIGPLSTSQLIAIPVFTITIIWTLADANNSK